MSRSTPATAVVSVLVLAAASCAGSGIAVTAGSVAELVRPDGTTERLPQEWHPAAWNPAGTELMVWGAGDQALGLWKPAEPDHVLRIGSLPRNVFFTEIAWVSKPAKV